MRLKSEASWTKPSEWCPRPELWHAPDPDTAEFEVADLLWGLTRALQPELVVETGTAHGFTAWRLAAALEVNGHGRLVTIEADAARATRARERFKGHKQVLVVNSSSLDWETDEVDLLFSDSDPNVRVKEVEHFNPAWWVLHDTAPHHPWAAQLREDISRLTSHTLVHLPTPRGVVIGQRL